MRVGATVLLTGLVLLPAGAGAAAPAPPPTAITGPVSAVGATSATATGTVNPNGQATSWYVEYGTSTSYGRRTSTRNAGSGTSNVAVSAALTGLAPGATYHYRLVATSGGGTSRGGDGVFTTAAAPVAVTGAAGSVTPTSVRLAASVDPNGRATNSYFEYGTTTAYGSRTPARSAGSGTSARNVSSPVTNLTPGHLYHYRVVATSDAGRSLGADRTFATTGPPLVRTGATLEIGPNAARPTGSVNPQGRQATWYFEYGTTPRYGSRTPNRSAGSGFGDRTVSWPISRLGTAVTYHYRLVARNAVGTTLGADLTFRTTGVTMATRTRAVVYGRAVMLAGRVTASRAAEPVTVYAQRFGAGSPNAMATVVTDSIGAWRFLARPVIRTAYLASWNGVTSRTVVIGVRPRVAFRRVGVARFRTRVLAARSFAGRRVRLQRRTAAGRWVTVKRIRLNRRSAARFRVRLRRPASRLRIVMSVNQAGPGYLAGISRTVVYRRR
jgi:hypothetical protein